MLTSPSYPGEDATNTDTEHWESMNNYQVRNRSNGGALSSLTPIFLAIATFCDALAGIFLLFSPSYVWLALGSAPVALIVLRWSGGLVISMAFGHYLAFRQPRGQARWVFLTGLGHVLSGLTLMYSISAGEIVGHAPWASTIANSALGVGLILFLSLPGVSRSGNYQ